jgi:hypothetical protein
MRCAAQGDQQLAKDYEENGPKLAAVTVRPPGVG